MSILPLALFNGSYLGRKPTGIGVVAQDLVQAFDPHLVPLLDPLGGDRPFSQPIPANLSPEHGRCGHLRRLIWTQQRLPGLLKDSGAELLFSPLPEAPLLRGVRTVVIAHDLLPLRYPQPSPLLAYHLAYVPQVLHRALRVLCNSESTADEVHSRLGVPLRQLEVIRLGFNPGSLKPLGIKREPFLLVLGRHDPHKNLGRALKAFAQVVSKQSSNTQDLELRLVGPHDKRYTPKLQELAVQLRISERCRWIPWVSDTERLQLLNRCQALMIVSLWEGFGLPALEALACGAPVIAAHAGALPEVVSDAGLLVDPRNTEAIASAINEVLHDPLIQREASRIGPARASKFRWDNTARKIEKMLADMA